MARIPKNSFFAQTHIYKTKTLILTKGEKPIENILLFFCKINKDAHGLDITIRIIIMLVMNRIIINI